MTAANSDDTRRLLPRWRPWRSAVLMKELSPSRPNRDRERFTPALDSAISEFRQYGGLSRASELIAASRTAASDHPSLDAAVSMALSNQASSSLLRALAQGLDPTQAEPSPMPSPDDESRISFQRLAIRELRQRTRKWPKNALTWVDLGRAYFAVGQNGRARRCLEIALALDPDNRFIVRSAVRFLVHTNDEETARAVVLQTESHEVDPWLLSVGVALGARNRRPTLKLARSMLEDGTYSPWHLAELGATIATLEHEHGQERSAKKLMRGALVDPTENVLAHAEWASWASHLAPTQWGPKTQPTEPSEALARRFAKDFDWRAAAAHARLWQLDQPFAPDAAGLGSWYAIEAGDYVLATSFCETGLLANPDDAALLNNRAFAAACQWKLREAAEDLSKIDYRHGESSSVGCALATAGFVAFRTNDIQLGRSLYGRAVRLFLAHRLSEHAARAAMNLAAEEKRVGSADAETAIRRASSLVKQAGSAEVQNTWLRIQTDEYLPGETPIPTDPTAAVTNWLYQGLPSQLDGVRDSGPAT